MSVSGTNPLDKAIELMARIRAEGAWESRQSHASLVPYLIEECWELIDAVDSGERGQIVSELGDLLLQVLFHSAIGAEHLKDPFDVQDVAQSLLDKLQQRAPYWFDGSGAAGMAAEEQDRLWQEAKARAKAQRGAEGAGGRGLFEGIAWSQPALALGQKVLERTRAVGFPEDLIPEQMLVVRLGPSGVFREGASAEATYRSVVREFAARLTAATSLLDSSARRTGGGSTAEEWAQAWQRASLLQAERGEQGPADSAE